MAKFILLQDPFADRMEAVIMAKVHREPDEAAHALPLEPTDHEDCHHHRRNNDDCHGDGNGHGYGESIVVTRTVVSGEHNAKVWFTFTLVRTDAYYVQAIGGHLGHM